MTRLLYLKASALEAHSYSVAVADAFVDTWRKEHADDEVVVENLFEMDLPVFDADAANGKYAVMHGKADQVDKATRAKWDRVVETIGWFDSFDRYVFAVPMWNFSIPWRLKQFIDVIVQPSYTFTYDPDKGYSGLLEDRPVFIAYARGGDYSEGSGAESYNHQSPYFEMILSFIGLTDLRIIVVQPTQLQGKEVALDKRAEAIETARAMAKDF